MTADELRPKVAETNRRTLQRWDTTTGAPPRCEDCWVIKRTRARALEAGDRDTAARMATEMGVHQRLAHV
ncbi:hypothetical protein GCM10010218_54580 [Streptomyces mashuensis]|uniref:Uncharacterized protein n=1 Tax=Streptomyces mashuensis TaxID=33904 RepID=A0A919B8U4_9ACTN|nr:hypothetical protein [Streptomyces mashuensis]GHF66172.1 hypothetical protein GCM10010218_54580 [Streptomyces mashuensis]